MIEKRKHAGFTLIELLVVVAIIGVLIGLLSTGIQRAVQKTKRTEALVIAKSIVTALEVFVDEYPEEDWPLSMASVSSEDRGGYVTEALYQMLSGEKVEGLNRRKMPFLDLGRDVRVAADEETGIRGLLDPWKRIYRLTIDVSDDGKIELMDGGELITITGHRVVAWSVGKDGLSRDPKTIRDNVRSWR
jgi:prepilin-type N-terminal cleavage/methylation domain-containing protein